MTNWNELKPQATDQLADFPSDVTKNAIAFREGIEKHFFWTDSSGLSAGTPRFTSLATMPGSARAFWGLQSQVSGVRDGTLMVTSDTSRLFTTPSNGSVLLGSRFAIIADGVSAATLPSNARWKVQSGSSTSILGNGTRNQLFASSYSGTPFVEATLLCSTNYANMGQVAVTAVNSSGFSYFITVWGSSSSFGLLWRSEGTVPL